MSESAAESGGGIADAATVAGELKEALDPAAAAMAPINPPFGDRLACDSIGA
jgi:hypothetical protein